LSVGTHTIVATNTPLPASKSPVLSTGAAAGLGIGVGLLFAATLALVIFLFRRNRRRKSRALQAEQYSHASYITDRGTWDGSSPHSVHAKVVGDSAANELPAHALAHEMEAPPVEMSGTPQVKEAKPFSLQPELHQG
jgi:NAD(P)-dependent dehydrogenase (short-subunit alcohol dehydrogenase family)